MWKDCTCMLSHFSWVWLFVTLWTVARQAPLSMGFSGQEHCCGLPYPPPEDLPDPGIEPPSLRSRALAGGFFTTITTPKLTYLVFCFPILSTCWRLSPCLTSLFACLMNVLNVIRDIPHGPVVKNPPSNAGDTGLILGPGTKIPHASGQLNPQIKIPKDATRIPRAATLRPNLAE